LQALYTIIPTSFPCFLLICYLHVLLHFCLGTGVPRHNAGGIGTFLHMNVVPIICNAHARVMEEENSIALIPVKTYL